MARPKGQPKLGGRQKGTKNKVCPSLKELAQTYTFEAVRKISQLMRDPKEPGAVQLAAAQTLLDRGWGKPAQALAVMTLNPLAHLSDDELRAQIDFLQEKHDAERAAVRLIEHRADGPSAVANCQDD